MRVLYLQRLQSVAGRDALSGRALVKRFQEISEEVLVAHRIVGEIPPGLSEKDLAPDVIALPRLRDFEPDVIFAEGGLMRDSFRGGMDWAAARPVVEEFTQAGGTFIAADCNINRIRDQLAAYRAASTYFGAAPYPGPPIYGVVEGTASRAYCHPESMPIPDWARPIYQGISKILISLPVDLNISTAAAPIATTDEARTILLRDDLLYQHGACIFGSARKFGLGYAVVIAASASADTWIKECADNLAWLTNIAKFFVEEAHANKLLWISQAISTPNRSILFVEGSTDKTLIESAWHAFHPDHPIPVEILSAGGAQKMKSLAGEGPALAAFLERVLKRGQLLFALADNDCAGRQLLPRYRKLQAGGTWIRQPNGVHWGLLEPSDEFKDYMARLAIPEAFWPFTIENAFSASVRRSAEAEGAYARSRLLQPDLFKDEGWSRRLATAWKAMSDDDDALFYIEQPTPEAKERFAQWIADDTRRAPTYFASFRNLMGSLQNCIRDACS
jgi:hypothetical protein